MSLELLKNWVLNWIEWNQIKLKLYIHEKLAPCILYNRNWEITIIKESSTEKYWFDKHLANRYWFMIGLGSTAQTQTKIKTLIDSPFEK